MPKFIQLWFQCDSPGCESRTEMMCPLDHLGQTNANDLPPGWGHKQVQDELNMFVAKGSPHTFCSRFEIVCHKHAPSCNHVKGVAPESTIVPYTVVCCGWVGLGGWQCIRHEGHDGDHDFGQDLYGTPIIDQPAPEE